MAEEKRKPFEAVAPESAGTIRVPHAGPEDMTPALREAWRRGEKVFPSRPNSGFGAGGRPDDAAQLAKKHPAPPTKAIAPRPDDAARLAKKYPPQVSPAAPAPAPAPSADPAQAAMDSALQDFTSSSPASRFDDDLMLSRIMMDGMAAAGLTDKYNQWKGVYADALTKRYKDVSDGAIRAAVAGDFGPAMAAYNHLVPNGVTITGYAQQPDGGLRLRFSDGRSQVMSSNQLMGMLTALSEPSKVLAMYDEIGKIGAQTQGKMAEQQQKAQLDALLEQIKHTYGVERDQLKAKAEAYYKGMDPTAKLQFSPEGQAFITRGGQVFEYHPEAPSAVVEGVNTPAYTKQVFGAPQAGAAAPISRDNPGWR